MIGSIFTPKYILVVAVLFAISSFVTISLSHKGDSESKGAMDATIGLSASGSSDSQIDKALGYAIDGNHAEAVRILQPLAEKGVIRAKLYLATAYYHGNGVARDREKARQLFFDLQAANYEPHIVNTYLSLLGSPR